MAADSGAGPETAARPGDRRLTIVVDENIPYALESFGRFGSVRVLPGRRIAAADVEHADALIVRSVTRVDESLLARSRVRFVGTATIGWDHVDLDYLHSRGIAFASAPGSNATSVAEYVVAALLQSARARDVRLDGATIAVVGVGNVGRRVVEKAAALGLRCVLNDPPRARAEGASSFTPLADALPQADYVTVHVPLVRTGPDATVNLAAAPFFGAMRAGAVFLNTSRGAVVDEAALAAALDAGRVSHAVLDVWQNEPAIDPALVRWAFIATAHIAGYSFDGKVAATQMICGALAAWLTDGATAVDLSPLLPAPPVPIVDVTEHTGGDEDVLRTIVSRVYDIGEDDRALREAMASDAPAARFDLLRKTYWQRREFRHTTVVASAARASLIRRAAQLGFQVRTH